MPRYSAQVQLTLVYAIEYWVNAESEDHARARLRGLHDRGFLYGDYDIKPNGGWLPDDVMVAPGQTTDDGWKTSNEEDLTFMAVEMMEVEEEEEDK